MGFLQRWLDEPDESIGRFAKAFYVLTFVFAGVLCVQLVLLVLRTDQSLRVNDFTGPLVSLLLVSTMYSLALDGRRSHKALHSKGDKTR